MSQLRYKGLRCCSQLGEQSAENLCSASVAVITHTNINQRLGGYTSYRTAADGHLRQVSAGRRLSVWAMHCLVWHQEVVSS